MLCTNGLHGLKRAGYEIPSEGAWRTVADGFWKDLFHTEKSETVNCKLAGEVLTDGLSVSIVLRKPRRDASLVREPVKAWSQYGQVWGLDAGRTDMFTCVDDNAECQHYSTRQFYMRAKYRQSTKTFHGWQDHNAIVDQAFKAMPTKTASIACLEAHVKYVLPLMERLMQWHMTKPFCKLKLRRYIFGQKAMTAICK